MRFGAFTPPKEQDDKTKSLREISVDRCAYLSESRAVDLGWERAPARGGKFYGWAIISAGDARGCGTEVISSPKEGNVAHADITLPPEDVVNVQDRNARLVELAKASSWRYLPVL